MSTGTASLRESASTQRALAALDTAFGGAALPPDRAEALLARIAWTRIAEPGDGSAHELVESLGAWEALQLIASGATAAELHAACGKSSADAVETTPRGFDAALKRWRPRLDREATRADIALARRKGLRVLLPGDPLWPHPFTDLGRHAPLALWVRGDPRHLTGRALSVVGARAASGYGSDVTSELAAGAALSGATIVSGAAYGIDAVAHRTALHLELPTVAILAGGADRAYPRAHEELLRAVSRHGTVCSEMPPGAAPTRWRFLMRNRLIAALGTATLVTEAGARSGTLNTAGHASQLGRTVGAVPGPVTSAASAGCHRLIREYGAILVTSVPEVLELIGGPAADQFEGGAAGESLSPEFRQPATHRRFLDALPLRGSRTLRDAAARAGLDPGEAREAVIELELLGNVARDETPEDGEVRWRLLRRE